MEHREHVDRVKKEEINHNSQHTVCVCAGSNTTTYLSLLFTSS